MYWVEDKKLRIAKSLNTKDWQSPKSLLAIRKLAKTCSTYKEMAEALGWSVTATPIRLKKYNIRPGLPLAKSDSKEALTSINSIGYTPKKIEKRGEKRQYQKRDKSYWENLG